MKYNLQENKIYTQSNAPINKLAHIPHTYQLSCRKIKTICRTILKAHNQPQHYTLLQRHASYIPKFIKTRKLLRPVSPFHQYPVIHFRFE